MWIRSQDKTALMNATTIRMYYTGYKTEFRIYCDQKCIAEEYTNLGTYSTKEKALKVLNTIQESIDKKYYGVFQMPQDSEVE